MHSYSQVLSATCCVGSVLRLGAGAGKPVKTQTQRGVGLEPGQGAQRCSARARRSRAPFPAPAPKARWQPWCHSHCHSPPVAFLPPSCWDSVPHLRSNERRAVRTEGRDRASIPTVRRPLPLSVAEHIHAQLARNILIRY